MSGDNVSSAVDDIAIPFPLRFEKFELVIPHMLLAYFVMQCVLFYNITSHMESRFPRTRWRDVAILEKINI